MNAMMLGQAPDVLFGVHHPPRTPKVRSAGIVLCYPFGQEYMRAHRAFRQLALLLGGTGFHVMRFDYSGTGDSAGDADETSLHRWAQDAGVAADELKDSAEVSRVAFVGLRLGATVAALAAAGRTDVDAVVLWDPLLSATAYLEELTYPEVPHSSSAAMPDIVGVLGYPLTARMREEIAACDLREVRAPVGSGQFVLTSVLPDAEAVTALCPSGPRGTCAVVPTEGSWQGVDQFGGALIPVAQIGRIVAYLAEAIP